MLRRRQRILVSDFPKNNTPHKSGVSCFFVAPVRPSRSSFDKHSPLLFNRKELPRAALNHMPKLLKKSQPPKQESRLISRQQIALDLGIHLETVKRMESEGRLPPPLRISRKLIRYDRAAYEECLRAALLNTPKQPKGLGIGKTKQ